MNILHIIDTLSIGGAQILLKFFFSQKKDDSSIFLFALRTKKRVVKINHPNVFISKNTKRYSFAALAELRKTIEENDIKIIHCHLLKSQIFGWLLKKFWFPNIKLIFHEHGKIFLSNLFVSIFLRIAKKNVDIFIAVSQMTEKKLIQVLNLDNSKLELIYNFSNIQPVVKSPKKTETTTLGVIGRLCSHKGIDVLINALPFIRNKYRLLVIGVGSDEKMLKTLAKTLGVEQNIDFVGYLENVSEAFRKMDILVVPSRFESFGLVAIEAQMAGIPVIAANVGGLVEIIRHEQNGLKFESENIQDLSSTINFAMENPEILKKLAKTAQKDVKKYSFENFDKDLTNLYRKL